LVVVARFLALLELYREGQIRFEQVVALGELQVTWTGSESGEVKVSDEFDQPVKMESGEENV
jgi:segregation and condensation protein A